MTEYRSPNLDERQEAIDFISEAFDIEITSIEERPGPLYSIVYSVDPLEPLYQVFFKRDDLMTPEVLRKEILVESGHMIPAEVDQQWVLIVNCILKKNKFSNDTELPLELLWKKGVAR